jgi:hypothetical protein
MARLGINLPVIEKMLNHTSGSFGGVVGVYLRYTFADEKRTAPQDPTPQEQACKIAVAVRLEAFRRVGADEWDNLSTATSYAGTQPAPLFTPDDKTNKQRVF